MAKKGKAGVEAIRTKNGFMLIERGDLGRKGPRYSVAEIEAKATAEEKAMAVDNFIASFQRLKDTKG